MPNKVESQDVSSSECLWTIIDPKCLASDTNGWGGRAQKGEVGQMFSWKICKGDIRMLF